MNPIFELIVQLFQSICKLTGLRYAELNILVYCLLIPFTWALILAFRNRKHLMLPAIHLIFIYLYISLRGELNIFSRQLYERNVTWLEYFGKNTPQGYIYISLFIGVLVPVIMYALLLFLPAKKVAWAYLLFVLGLMGYELVVWRFLIK